MMVHMALWRIQRKTIRNTPYHLANSLVERLTHDFKAMKTDLMETMSYMEQKQQSSVYTTPTNTMNLSSQDFQSTRPSMNALMNNKLFRL